MSELVIAFFDLLEAEGKALQRGAIRTGIGLARFRSVRVADSGIAGQDGRHRLTDDRLSLPGRH